MSKYFTLFGLIVSFILTSCGSDGSTSSNTPAVISSGTSNTTPPVVTTPPADTTLTPEPTIFRASEAPKVVLFLMFDDLDFHDFGYNSIDMVTPNIDEVAGEGTIFSNYYAASGICSPTRVSVLTGQSPLHYGLSRLWPDLPNSLVGQNLSEYYWSLRGLPDTEQTLGKVMQDAGYKSIHMGKWHVGTSRPEYLPNGHGFDDFKIMRIQPDSGVIPFYGPNGLEETQEPQVWRPQFQANEIIDFIDESDGEPVFINWWPTEPHYPFLVPPQFDNTNLGFDLDTNRGKVQSLLYSFDQEFGRVVAHLKEQGLYEDSLIILTSDNGGLSQALSSNRLVSGSKGSLQEGGIRVPFSATWPNQIESGEDNTSVMTSYDILPTLASIVGAEIDDVLGEDFSSGLFGPSGFQRETSAYFELQVASWNGHQEFPNQHALRNNCYKIADFGEPGGTYKLYNLCTDPAESVDLSNSEPEIFSQMVTEIEQQRGAIGVVYETDNLNNELILSDQRLNIHHDDLRVSGNYVNGDGNIYLRDPGIYFSIQNGLLTARLSGPTNQSTTAISDEILLTTQINAGDEFELYIQGFLRSAATISILVNNVVVSQVAAPPSSSPNELGNSLYAIANSPESTTIVGDINLSIDDFQISLH